MPASTTAIYPGSGMRIVQRTVIPPWQRIVLEVLSRSTDHGGTSSKYGNETQVSRGQLTYTNAKADADAVIAGLIVALSTGQQPASLSSLQAKLNSSLSSLADFCGTV